MAHAGQRQATYTQAGQRIINLWDIELGSETRLDDAGVDRVADMIAGARRIVVFGGGREKLQIMGVAMPGNATLDSRPVCMSSF